MCAHPSTAKRRGYAIVDGRRYENTYCNTCKAEYQRMRRAIRRAFWLLMTARWA
jgi:hypothetical protein